MTLEKRISAVYDELMVEVSKEAYAQTEKEAGFLKGLLGGGQTALTLLAGLPLIGGAVVGMHAYDALAGPKDKGDVKELKKAILLDTWQKHVDKAKSRNKNYDKLQQLNDFEGEYTLGTKM